MQQINLIKSEKNWHRILKLGCASLLLSMQQYQKSQIVDSWKHFISIHNRSSDNLWSSWLLLALLKERLIRRDTLLSVIRNEDTNDDFPHYLVSSFCPVIYFIFLLRWFICIDCSVMNENLMQWGGKIP